MRHTPRYLMTDVDEVKRLIRANPWTTYVSAASTGLVASHYPTLLEETDKIMKAQASRGADFESGNILKRARNMVPLLVPLFVSAFRRADELAMAMEARCYKGGHGRTRMKVLRYTMVDLWAGLVTLALIAAVVLDRVFVLGPYL